jgi:F-type H+-transporting ATPase subunit a
MPFFGEALSPEPKAVFQYGGFVVTSSMLVTVITAIVIIAIVQTAMRAPKLIPSGLQNGVEWVVESIGGLLEQILGYEMMKRGFWFFATIFIFILSCNLIGLLPGVGTFGLGHGTNVWNFEVIHPYLRGPNADVNLTSAMSLVYLVTWCIWSWQLQGPWGIIHHIFGAKAHFANWLVNMLFGILFIFIGCIELISILFRPFTFTFRLYGNIYGGENLLDAVYHLSPNWAVVLLTPFYFQELLVAFIQAFVFFVLTAVFTALMRPSNDPSEAGAH